MEKVVMEDNAGFVVDVDAPMDGRMFTTSVLGRKSGLSAGWWRDIPSDSWPFKVVTVSLL